MEITRTSPLTGESHTLYVDVTVDQILDWQHGSLIQDAMPHLSADEREFIMSGITPSEWEDFFGGEGF